MAAKSWQTSHEPQALRVRTGARHTDKTVEKGKGGGGAQKLPGAKNHHVNALLCLRSENDVNLVPRARARLGQRRPRVHGLWDNQQPEARFLASGLKADTADPREGGLGIYLKDQKKRQPPPLPFANNSHSLGLP